MNVAKIDALLIGFSNKHQADILKNALVNLAIDSLVPNNEIEGAVLEAISTFELEWEEKKGK